MVWEIAVLKKSEDEASATDGGNVIQMIMVLG